MVVSRRMYRDSDGGTVLWTSVSLQLAPSITERVVEMATDAVQEGVRYGERTDCRGTVSKTAHRLLQSVGEEALAEERERWESQFERGED